MGKWNKWYISEQGLVRDRERSKPGVACRGRRRCVERERSFSVSLR